MRPATFLRLAALAFALVSLPVGAGPIEDALAILDPAEEPVEPAFAGAFYPTQSAGNRGNDVVAIQHLLKHRGYSASVTGVFDSATDSTVRSFQSAAGLTSDGIVGPNTWGALVVTVQQGSAGEAVKALQKQLNEKRFSGLVVDGVFGPGTRNAVVAFQQHAGISADGIVGPTTWRNLVWHYERADTAPAALCTYSVSTEIWGTAAAVGQLEAAASQFYATGNGPLSLGDMGLEHGGDIAGHASHEDGLDGDIRPVRTDSGQCSFGCRWDSTCYDRAGTRALAQALRAKASGHVKVIWFNDPTLINEGLTSYLDAHDDHLHVRWCEKVHPDSRYDC